MFKNNVLKFLLPAIIILLISATHLFAQLKCKIVHYSTEDGLSHERVTSILKDRDGFMWLGTWDGLNRFDGHNFITFKSYPGDNSGLKNNRIDQMVDDATGYLWIEADDKQIYRFDKKTGIFLPITNIINSGKTDRFIFDKIIALKDGSIWILTKNQGIFNITDRARAHPKLVRYASDQNGIFKIPSDKINFFYEDNHQHIWIGTPKGIAHLYKGKSNILMADACCTGFTSQFNCLSITEDINGILFTTANGYLISYNHKLRQFTSKCILENGSLNAVSVSKKRNVLYCTTSLGTLLTLNSVNWNILKTDVVDQHPVFSIYEDSKGLVWLEPYKMGVIKYNPANATVKYFAQKNDSNFGNGPEYFKVFEDAKGLVWANMKGCGFGFYDEKKDNIAYFFNEPDVKNHYFSNIVNDQYYDPAGVLWLSTDDRGIDKILFQRNDFHQKILVEHSSIKSDNEVRATYHDRENRLWIATKQGKLYISKNGTPVNNLFQNKAAEANIGQVYTIYEDHQGIIWLGTKANGIWKAQPANNGKTQYTLTNYLADKDDPESICSNIIYSFVEDRKGRIWVGTYQNGIMVIVNQNHETRFYSTKNAFKNYPQKLYRKVRHLALDAAGNVWAGTTDGLLITDANRDDVTHLRFTGYNKIPGDSTSLGNNDVQFIYRDSNKNMWLATCGGGLSMAIGNDPYKILNFKTFTIKDGLPNDYILSCIEDNRGNLWLATQKGLSEFNITRKHFRNFDSYDGLPKNGFSESACLKLPDGQLVFGAVTGYSQFNPDSIIDHKINANMALTNFQVNNKEVNVSGDDDDIILKTDINKTTNITLNYNQNLINIDYGVLDYRSNNKQIYAYRLSGFENAWNIDNKGHRKATYSYLPPGKYVFHVKSLNDDLYTKTPEKTLNITILPPLWRTWWAYLIYLFLALLIIELIRRTVFTMLRLRQRIAVEKKLTELKLSFFTNISHELRTPLTLILNPVDEILKKEKLSDKGVEYARVIQKNANRMVSFVNQLLDLRKVQSGKATLNISYVEIVTFVKNTGSFFKELAIEKQITLEFTTNTDELFAWVDAEKLDMVIYNLLANAFKFSCTGTAIKVFVEQDCVSNSFQIRISDQGIGVPADKLNDIFELYYEGEPSHGQLKGTGIGLALSKELVELHQGKICAVNNPDRGLEVTIQLHLGKVYLQNSEVNYVNYQDTININRLDVDESSSLIANILPGQDDLSLPLILLVEDNYDLRKFLAAQLGDKYRVAEAENGQAGWEMAQNIHPDLILSDVMMPLMDGIQMLDKLKNHIETSHIPVVLLSAKSAIENQVQGLKYGADYYITKPFSSDLIFALIENLLNQRKQMLEALMGKKSKLELGPSQIVITSKDELFLKRVIEIVEEAMADPDFNIETVAESIGMSRSAFYKKFKSLTSLTPVEFTREIRLKRGKQYLDAGENDIAHIAYTIGFSDPKYFSTCFKKQFQLTPSEYLKSRKFSPQQVN